jgi:serine-type D-Ala-D-Ala carboxypeptidase
MTPREVAARIVVDGVAPLCAAGCSARVPTWRRAVGGDEQCVFDLASLTKPLTAVAVVAAGIDRRVPLADLLPEVRGTASAGVPVELLLAHRGGLRAHIALYEPMLRGATIDLAIALRGAANARREDAPRDLPVGGFAPLYSDLGYVLAGAALARFTGQQDAGAAIQKLVLAPLGIDTIMGTIRDLSAHRAPSAFAATEDVPWRGGRIQGQVHDENAWALTGIGGSGHAGLFGTVRAVLAFGEAVADAIDSGDGPLGHLDLHWLVEPRGDSTLRAGFVRQQQRFWPPRFLRLERLD